ncbi:paxillin-like isoform X2 [Dinothrombium tinctorium]|uniref:Paxillin-like isoform X2 n=1 Tax=Dinothrombium tinctorium TaxID=1965070 RepID=A0A443RJC9_9ACAR|nr:paxillin-like isoform X2 [Dinothrombium tinctorium]
MEDLDTLLADLENATHHLKSNQPMASPLSVRSPPMYSSEVRTSSHTYGTPSSPEFVETEVRTSSARYGNPGGERMSSSATTTTTITKKYTSKGYSDEPLYENEIMVSNSTKPMTSQSQAPFAANLSELDNLLEDLNSVRIQQTKSNGTASSPTYPRDRTDSVQVNQLISDLEHNLHNPQQSPKWKGKEIKPIISTKYYVESTATEVIPQTATSSPQHAVSGSTKPPTASNATQELDDLMASLSDFKPQDKGVEPEKPAPSPHFIKSQPLDSMIGTLQSDMSKQGVDTTAKGHCHACHKPIVGQVVTALGKTWHPEHFTCVSCNCELGTKNFFERDGAPYCETDYHNLFSPRCAYCNAPILDVRYGGDKCVTALDRTWHTEHFFCAQCGKQFGDDGFHEKDGKPYCREDYFDLFAPKCGGCNTAITDNYISALNSQWHPDCFVCRDCRCPFVGGSFFDHEGQPYCETHYHAKRGSLCAGCHKPITGRCITAMFRKFHPEHFVCSFCLKQLNKGTFKEQNDKPYCHPCFEKLFG